jgi:hypothetical protein
LTVFYTIIFFFKKIGTRSYIAQEKCFYFRIKAIIADKSIFCEVVSFFKSFVAGTVTDDSDVIGGVIGG